MGAPLCCNGTDHDSAGSCPVCLELAGRKRQRAVDGSVLSVLVRKDVARQIEGDLGLVVLLVLSPSCIGVTNEDSNSLLAASRARRQSPSFLHTHLFQMPFGIIGNPGPGGTRWRARLRAIGALRVTATTANSLGLC
jgi:hypothetical protein